MFYLGLLLPVCFVPGWTGASVPTQWVVLTLLLPLYLWPSVLLTEGHKLFLWFLAYAALSVYWSMHVWSWVWGMWFVTIWILCYHYGTLHYRLRNLWRGLAVGASLSTFVALAQWFGFSPVEALPGTNPGLFFNPALATVVLGLVLVGCLCHKLWWYMPIPALGLVLTGHRGGWAVFALGLGARYLGWVGGLGVLIAGAFLFVFSGNPSDIQRLQILGITGRVLDLIGHGAGSFVGMFYVNELGPIPKLVRPEYVHNDPFQLFFEFGVAALIPAVILGMALRQSSHREWPVVFAFAGLSLFFFPLYTPITAFIGLVVMGHMLRDWHSVLHRSRDWRSYLLSWPAYQQLRVRILGR